MMTLKWFNAREATEVGIALADQFAAATATQPAPPLRGTEGRRKDRPTALTELLERADREVRSLELNLYQKARFANSFKWRLIEKGVEPSIADAVTQSLLVHLAHAPAGAAEARGGAAGLGPADPERIAALLARAHKALAERDYAHAVDLFEEFVSLVPGHADALNALGVALFNLGRYQEAEQRYREAIDINPEYANALMNLAAVLQANPEAAEPVVRRVLKINPKYPEARATLGNMLLSSGREHEAKVAFRKAL